MAKNIDIGQRFGKLTVLEEIQREPGDYQRRFLCQCDCGVKKVVLRTHLVSGRSKSCGCAAIAANKKRHEKKRKEIEQEYIGKRFGELTVDSRAKDTDRGGMAFNCTCDCGKKITVPQNDLQQGQKSCGCRKMKSVLIVNDMFRENECKEGTVLCTLTSKLSSANTSGYKGVHWNKQMQKWQARITLRGKRYNLGFYENIHDAAKARELAEEEYFWPLLEKYGRKHPTV